MMRKLKSRSGETLAELLAAIVIGALSSLVLLTAVSAASHLDQKAVEADRTFYSELNGAEAGTLLQDRRVTMELSEHGRPVSSFTAQLQGAADGGDDRLLSYSVVKEAEAP